MAGYRPRGPVSAPAPPPPPPPTYRHPHPLLFTRPLLQFGTATYRPTYRATGGTITVSLVVGPVQPLPAPRPPRQLTVRQQRALDALVALGAELDANFTARELRSALSGAGASIPPGSTPVQQPHREGAACSSVRGAEPEPPLSAR